VRFFVRNALVALYPRAHGLPGIEDCDLDAFLKKFSKEAASLLWLGVVLSALLFQATPLFTVFVPLPAFLLPSGLRDRHANKITYAPLYLVRQAIFLLKLPGGLCWGTHPEVRKHFALAAYEPDPTNVRVT
jgi:hypothetical protein